MNQSQPDLSELNEESETTADDLADLMVDEDEQQEQEEVEETESEEEEVEAEQPSDDWKSKTYIVNGEELSGAELEAGYMKDAHFRQKTERAAQSIRQSEQVIQEATQERAFLANRVGALIQASEEEIVGNQQELARLAVENPAQWVAKQAEMSVKSQRLNALYQQRDAMQARNQEVFQAQQQQFAQREYETLLEKVPEWRNEAKRDAEQSEMMKVAMSLGYTADELNNIFDHRAIMTLKLAAEAIRRKQLKPTPAQGRTVQPNAAKPNSGNRPNQASMRKVFQTGSQEQRLNTIADLL